MNPKDLTERQVEQLLYIAGIKKLGPQSYYYGRNRIVNRNLWKKGLIERASASSKRGWILTPAGRAVIDGENPTPNTYEVPADQRCRLEDV